MSRLKIIEHIWGYYAAREFGIAKKYFTFSLQRPEKMVIYNHDSRFNDNGLADKIRGMVSSYAYAKATGKKFRINHIEPFHLEDYFVPNEVDWRLETGEMSNSWFWSWPVIILDKETAERLPKYSHRRQYHLYSNVDFLKVINDYYGTQYSFTKLHNELFKPSLELIDAVSPYRKMVDEGYISISFRFMQLMGDFIDVRGITLTIEEQIELIQKCQIFIEEIHYRHPSVKWIFVTSDSSKFLNSLKCIEYVFTVPGEISHLGSSASKAACMKTFVDYYLISKANKAYLGYSGKMYKSNFARSAAESTGIPFEFVQF